MGARTWPEDWEARVEGLDCPMCGNQGLEDNGFGRRILCGEYADVYLQRATPMPGYVIAVWKHGHVVEPTDLQADAAAGYWSEVMDAARAVRAHFGPTKLNFMTLGNGVPHLHTHVLPRYVDDAVPCGPVPWDLISSATPMDKAEFTVQVVALRTVIGDRGI